MAKSNKKEITITANGKKMLTRAKAAFKTQDPMSTEIREIYKYAMPNRNVFDTEEDRMTGVFDSTAISAAARFANRLQTDLTPPFQKWFVIKAGPLIIDADERLAMNEKLEFISDICRAAMTSGGFTTAGHELYQDIAAGQGVMLILPANDGPPVRFISVPATQSATENGEWGEQIGLHWKRKLLISQLDDFWPNAKFSEDLGKKVKEAASEDKATVFMSFVRDKEDHSKWDYVVTVDVADEVIFEQKFGYKPFVAPRWSKQPGDDRGRGPLHLAIPDIKTINKVKELLLASAALAIVGAYTVIDDGVLNADNLSIEPGALIPVSSNGSGFSGPSIKELPTGRNFDLSQLLLEDLRTSIKKIMLDDQLPPDLGPVRSATEIVARAKELAQDSGAAFGRLYDEYLVPTIQAVVAILTDLGVITEDIEIDNLQFNVQILSSLARVQDLADIETIVQYVEIAASIAGPEALLVTTKLEELLPWIAERMGVPAKFIRDEEERTEFEKVIAAQKAAESGMLNASNENEIPTQEGLIAA